MQQFPFLPNMAQIKTIFVAFCIISFLNGFAQIDTLKVTDTVNTKIQEDSLSLKVSTDVVNEEVLVSSKVYYGMASFYADKFNGRRTASGEIFNQNKLTCACNKLPLGSRIRVTNIKNGKSVIVKVNDRLHPKMKRLVDLTRSAARQLGYISSGLTKVKVEVLGHSQIIPGKKEKPSRKKKHR